MHGNLHITIDAPQTIRRDSRRIVAITTGLLIGILAGFLAFRAPYTISRTACAAAGTNGNTVSIRMLKTPEAVETLQKKIGNAPLLPGAPITLPALFALSKREMRISFTESGEIAYTVDAGLPQELRNELKNAGVFTAEIGNSTTLSLAQNQPACTGIQLEPFALLPWHDGEVRDGSHSGRLSLTKYGMTLHGIGAGEATTHMRVPESATVSAYLTASPNAPTSTAALLPLLSSPIGSIIDLFAEMGGTLVLTEDNEGEGFSLSTPSQEITTEEMVRIGKDIIGRTELSTQDWTISDGTTYQELRSDSDDVAVDIRAEEDFTYIDLTTQSGTLRMTKTPEFLTITNRRVSLNEGEKAQSLCLKDAHSWINFSRLENTDRPTTSPEDATQVFMHLFSEIAENEDDVRLCW